MKKKNIKMYLLIKMFLLKVTSFPNIVSLYLSWSSSSSSSAFAFAVYWLT